MAELEHVSDLNGRRDVRDPEVVAHATVNADGDSDHARMVSPEDGRRLVAGVDAASADEADRPEQRGKQRV